MIRVIVVHAVRLYRDGLAQVLGQSQGIEVVATADGWARARKLVEGLQPDVALLDLDVAEGPATVKQLARSAPRCKLLALGVAETEADVIAWAEAGVAGYVTREETIGECVATVEAVARGELPCSPSIAAALFRRVGLLAAAPAPFPEDDLLPELTLTRRQLEVVQLIDAGLSNKEIARQLRIELPTVKNHVHNILEKLHVNRRAEAAARLRTGIRIPVRAKN